MPPGVVVCFSSDREEEAEDGYWTLDTLQHGKCVSRCLSSPLSTARIRTLHGLTIIDDHELVIVVYDSSRRKLLGRLRVLAESKSEGDSACNGLGFFVALDVCRLIEATHLRLGFSLGFHKLCDLSYEQQSYNVAVRS